VLLDALGKDADEDHDGLISMSELTHYAIKLAKNHRHRRSAWFRRTIAKPPHR
jgi:hypothetical protein